MNRTAAIIAFGILVGTSAGALAKGPVAGTPAASVRTNGSVQGTTGASGYTPGYQMQNSTSTTATSPGASSYAPGHTAPSPSGHK